MATPKHLWYPENLTDHNIHPAWLQFKFQERKSTKESEVSDTVDLYMPEQTSNPSAVHWGQENFGFVGNAIRTGITQGLNNISTDSIMSGVTGTVGGIAGAMRGGTDVVTTRFLANAGSAIASMMGGNVSAEGLIGEVTGKIPNPYLTVIFQGVNFRTFSFVFKFHPFSEEDCERIYEIIRTFRKHSLPHTKSDDAFLGYPSQCSITYKWQGKDNPWLHKFKPAVCTAIDIDYTSQSMFSVMRNGFPSEITMSTKWTELEIVTREDVEDDTKRY